MVTCIFCNRQFEPIRLKAGRPFPDEQFCSWSCVAQFRKKRQQEERVSQFLQARAPARQ
jgi:hypothetical protein